jgi:hypothetical protein
VPVSPRKFVEERRIVVPGPGLVYSPRHRPHAQTILGGRPQQLSARLALEPRPIFASSSTTGMRS